MSPQVLLLFLSKCRQDRVVSCFLVLMHVSGRSWAGGVLTSLLRFPTLGRDMVLLS